MSNLNKLVNTNFLSSLDLSVKEINYLLELAKKIKNKDLNIKYKDKILGLIFDKSSTCLLYTSPSPRD